MELSPNRSSALTNQDSGSNDSSHASTKTAVKHDGQRLVHNDVAEEQCDQNPMFSLLQKLEDSFGVPLLRVVGVFGDDLQIYAVLAHQSDGQPGKSTTEEDQEHGSDVENPELGARLLLVSVVELLHDADWGSRCTHGEESFGHGEDGGAEGHQRMGGRVVLTHGRVWGGRVRSDEAVLRFTRYTTSGLWISSCENAQKQIVSFRVS